MSFPINITGIDDHKIYHERHWKYRQVRRYGGFTWFWSCEILTWFRSRPDSVGGPAPVTENSIAAKVRRCKFPNKYCKLLRSIHKTLAWFGQLSGQSRGASPRHRKVKNFKTPVSNSCKILVRSHNERKRFRLEYSLPLIKQKIN